MLKMSGECFLCLAKSQIVRFMPGSTAKMSGEAQNHFMYSVYIPDKYFVASGDI